ncbi:hypothetical protein K4K54_003837 [Colletotrichum sp. SAR 10_86]|nr:hypothetical protein K4K54_003837 [Colletotrichum sp. SAR 10_86]KAJ4999212.1 hypothetical protein K4K48_004449 [Colletotrichum sp. SAR 10_66]
MIIPKHKLSGILNGISRFHSYPVCVWTYQIASEVQGEGRLGEPTPALCHTGAGVTGVISEDKNAEAEVKTIIKTVEAEPAVVLDVRVL